MSLSRDHRELLGSATFNQKQNAVREQIYLIIRNSWIVYNKSVTRNEIKQRLDELGFVGADGKAIDNSTIGPRIYELKKAGVITAEKGKKDPITGVKGNETYYPTNSDWNYETSVFGFDLAKKNLPENRYAQTLGKYIIAQDQLASLCELDRQKVVEKKIKPLFDEITQMILNGTGRGDWKELTDRLIKDIRAIDDFREVEIRHNFKKKNKEKAEAEKKKNELTHQEDNKKDNAS